MAKQKFKKVEEVSISEIITRPKVFQGRTKSEGDGYSQKTFDNIVNYQKYFDKSMPPIEVWKDEAIDKYVVISGHSRFAAAKELFKRGQEDLETLPIKEFVGDLEAAKDYAFSSNRQGTAESLLSDVRDYKRKIAQEDPACNKQCLLANFKTNTYISKLQDYSRLNEEGRFLEELNKPTYNEFSNIENFARWTGKLRKDFPNITDKHENEIFEAVYDKQVFGSKTPDKNTFNVSFGFNYLIFSILP